MFEEIRDNYFPAQLVPGITARVVDPTTIYAVWDAIAHRVFGSLEELGNYSTPPERSSRARRLREAYAGTHREHIVFYNEQDEPVGWSSGAMLDSETFFMSYSGVLPEYQGRGIYSAFLKMFMAYLHSLGYERVTSNHMVNNPAVLIAKLKAGFVITGTVLDERWGAQVSMAYFFYEDRRKGFTRAYSVYDYPGVPDYIGTDQTEPSPES